MENNMDVFFSLKNFKFRVRACGIIIKDEKVLMVKNNIDDYYYSLGGAVRLGEKVEDACLREVLEETGYPYKIKRLQFIHESVFQKKDGLWHEIAFYYLMEDDDNDTFIISEGSFGAYEKKVWIPVKEFHNYNAYPKFFNEELLNLGENVKLISSI